jgi:hypothetical protein
MDAGTITGIVIGAVAGIGLLLSLGYKLGSDRPSTFSPATGFPVPLKILHYFMPYSLAFYTMFNDVVYDTPMYTPGLLLGIVSVWLNTTLSNLGVDFREQSGLCTIPGLSGWTAYEVPQPMIFIMAVLSYIGGFNTSVQIGKGSNYAKIIPPWILLAAILIIQAVVMYSDKCFDPSNTTFKTIFGGVGNVLILLVVGAASAGIGYAMTTLPQFAEGATGTPGFTSAGPPKPPMTKSSDPNVGTCSAPNDQDQFVCEAYKNGELVTSTITEGFIGK